LRSDTIRKGMLPATDRPVMHYSVYIKAALLHRCTDSLELPSLLDSSPD